MFEIVKKRKSGKMTHRRGFSLLEILISMLLFMIVFATFAMVFPSGFHLNLKSYRHNQSIDLADAILQEISNKPFYCSSNPTLGDSLGTLKGWTSETSWVPQALTNFRNNNPQLSKQYQYQLAAPNGISVQFLSGGNPLGCGFPNNSNYDNPLAQISVTLQWKEVGNGGAGSIPTPRSVTLTSYVTYNR